MTAVNQTMLDIKKNEIDETQETFH